MVRSRSVQSIGASVPVDLGVPNLLACGCVLVHQTQLLQTLFGMGFYGYFITVGMVDKVIGHW